MIIRNSKLENQLLVRQTQYLRERSHIWNSDEILYLIYIIFNKMNINNFFCELIE
jgi:hypothetical protein